MVDRLGPVKKPGSQWENHDLTILLRSFDEIFTVAVKIPYGLIATLL